MAGEFAFVPTDGSAIIRPSMRRLIRQHCMKGRNKQPNSRRARDATCKEAASREWKAEDNCQRKILPRPPSNAMSQVQKNLGWTMRETNTQPLHDCPAIPPPPTSDWALFRFPGELDTISQELLHRYFVRNPIRDPICPFELFNVFIDLGQDPLQCFRALAFDFLCFQATLLLASACEDLMSQRPLSSGTLSHLRRLLPILHDRLSDTASHQTDLILFAVGIMVSVAVHFGDHIAIATHAVGLKNIISLRGGFRALDHNPMVQFSIDRLNFSNALITQDWTPLYDSSIWDEPTFSNQPTNLDSICSRLSIDGLVDPRLETVFRRLQETTCTFNKHFYEHGRIDGRLVQRYLGFVHSRLLELDGQLADPFSETLRLGMMAFLGTTFRIPGLGVQRAYKNIIARLQYSYASITIVATPLHEQIISWLMVVHIMFTNSQDILRVPEWWTTTTMHGHSWETIRCYLKEVMWVDSFHDEPGRKAYNILTR